MYIISIVIENEKSEIGLYNEEYKLLAKKNGLSEDAGKLCFDILSESEIKSSDVRYVGIAADGDKGEIIAEIEKAYSIKCCGATLTEARALGEAYAANDAPFSVALKIDDKVECGLVVDKKIYSGVKQQRANVANMVINFGGYECSCGRRGCFEAYASLAGLKRIAADCGVADSASLTHEKLFAMDTPEAEAAKKLYVEYLASGITNIINLFQPNVMTLEGPFAQVGDALVEPLMETILREQYTHSMPDKCDVKFTKAEADTLLVGAALIGR